MCRNFYKYVCVFAPVYIHTCDSVCIHVCILRNTYIWIYVYFMHRHTKIYMYVCVYVYAYVYVKRESVAIM